MTPADLAQWAAGNPWPATAAAAVAVAAAALALWALTRAAGTARTALQDVPGAVIAAAVAAAACTAYSADTSWRFAANELGMDSVVERAALFTAGEVALFATALMARQNLRTQGAPGTPGVLVWVITGVQVIPAYSQSPDLLAGTVRAVLGPVLAALMWHLAMGIELRHATGDDSQSLPALLARELRERLLSRLGLATRNRTAEQITRDRWTHRAVDLAARLAQMTEEQRIGWRGRRLQRRLDRAVGRATVGADYGRRQVLMDLLAARRHSASLYTVDLPDPWAPPKPKPERPDTAQARLHRALTRMHPTEAIRVTADAHPHLDAPGVASLLISYGVVVSAEQVALVLGEEPTAPAPHPIPSAPAPAPAPDALPAAPAPSAPVPAPASAPSAPAPGDGPAPSTPADAEALADVLPLEMPAPAGPRTSPPAPAPAAGQGHAETIPSAPAPDAPADTEAAEDHRFLPAAREVDAASRAESRRPASVRRLKRELRVGQARAERIRELLDREAS